MTDVLPTQPAPLTRRQAMQKAKEATDLVALCDNLIRGYEGCVHIKLYSGIAETTLNVTTPEQRSALKAALEVFRQQHEDNAQKALADAVEAEVI